MHQIKLEYNDFPFMGYRTIPCRNHSRSVKILLKSLYTLNRWDKFFYFCVNYVGYVPPAVYSKSGRLLSQKCRFSCVWRLKMVANKRFSKLWNHTSYAESQSYKWLKLGYNAMVLVLRKIVRDTFLNKKDR